MRTMRLVLFVLIIAGCETSTSVQDSGAVPPLGVWALRAFELSGGQVVIVPDPTRYTLELLEGGQLNARTDCNVCNGTYQLSGNNLSIGLLACTLAACSADSLEGPYVDALGSAARFELEGDLLLIRYAEGMMRFGRL